LGQQSKSGGFHGVKFRSLGGQGLTAQLRAKLRAVGFEIPDPAVLFGGETLEAAIWISNFAE
jgi:hypothetical protein